MRVRADCTFDVFNLFVHEHDRQHAFRDDVLAKHIEDYLQRHAMALDGGPMLWRVLTPDESGLYRFVLSTCNTETDARWLDRYPDADAVRKGFPKSVVECLDCLNSGVFPMNLTDHAGQTSASRVASKRRSGGRRRP